MSDEPTIGILNRLIETNLDGEQGYKIASETLIQTELVDLCLSYSRQRASFASELQREVQRLGGEAPVQQNRVSAVLEWGWGFIKGSIKRGDQASIISGCQNAEDVGLKIYSEALEAGLTPEVRATLVRQKEQIQEARHRMAAMTAVTSVS